MKVTPFNANELCKGKAGIPLPTTSFGSGELGAVPRWGSSE